MRDRRILRSVNALASQQRLIIHLECSHNITVTNLDYAAHQMAVDRRILSQVWPCQFCEDPPPPQKTVIQMWHEAGEPDA